MHCSSRPPGPAADGPDLPKQVHTGGGSVAASSPTLATLGAVA